MTQHIFNYGGGRQTVAILLLIKRGIISKPDRVVIADTGRENPSTWEYREQVAEPLAQTIGLTIEIAPRLLAYVDLYGHNGDLLLPVWTRSGKLSAFCSDEWKASVVSRYLHLTALGYTPEQIAQLPHSTVRAAMKQRLGQTYIHWIGFALDERQRVKSQSGRRYPLLEIGLTKRDCRQIIADADLPEPPPSSCFICANKSNTEWRYLRDCYPAAFAAACELDEEIRAEDIARGGTGVWLHQSRVPLRDADLSVADRHEPSRQCGLGLCMV